MFQIKSSKSDILWSRSFGGGCLVKSTVVFVFFSARLVTGVAVVAVAELES